MPPSMASNILQRAATSALIGRQQTVAIPNIIEFLESSWGLKYRLFPGQRFVLKLFYHLPLDDVTRDIVIKDPFSGETAHEFTEVEYLAFLRKEGRISPTSTDADEPWKTLVLVIGRRGSKSELAALISVYEIWRLLCLKNPQEHYGLPPGEYIDVICISVEKDQAANVLSRAKARFQSCPFFAPFIANDTQISIRFRTQADIDAHGKKAAPSIRVSFRSSVAKGLRGPGYVVVILDEFAFFQNEGGQDAYSVWEAVTPATATFSPKDPNDNRVALGPSDGRVIAISSPASTDGKFYELYLGGMAGDPGMLVVQAPTWEVNPSLPRSEYRKKFNELRDAFWAEFGARFVSKVRKWIEREADIADCVFEEQSPATHGRPRVPYFIGFDLGLTAGGSGTALAVSHPEDGYVVLDLVAQIRAGEGRYEHRERLDVEEDVVPWLLEIHEKFNVHAGMLDQFNGYMLEQHLHRRGFSQYKAEHITQDMKSNHFQRFKLLMYDRRVHLYNVPSVAHPDSPWADYILELLDLEAKRVGLNLVSVNAPHGKHDDTSDAIVRSVWLSSERLDNVVTSGDWRRNAMVKTVGGSRSASQMRMHLMTHGDARRDPKLHRMFSQFRGMAGARRR